ncbi:MAG TPA: IPT/TIG domain-containing protein, partial [Vicinamibacterales bacterium]
SHMWEPRPTTREEFVAWPPPGYVPYQVVFPRWSFSYPSADFFLASVTMTENQQNVALVLETVTNGYGENTLVWVPGEMPTNQPWPRPAADTTYRVAVSNVRIAGSPRSFTYDVIVMDPGPTITTVTGVTPGRGPVVGGTAVTITGTNFFTEQTAVAAGGAAATSVEVIDATSLTAVTPAHAAGAVDVVVTTPAGTATLPNGFAYVPALPPFTDDPLVARSTVVRGIHVTELRQRIDELRIQLGLAAYGWTDVPIAAGVTSIRAIHLAELRTALNEAYAAAGRAAPTYTNAAVVGGATIVTAVDLAEIRTAIAALW